MPNPKCVLAASCGIEPGRIVEYKPLLDKAISISDHKPEFCVVAQREQCEAGLADGRDFDWSEFATGAKPADCIPVEGTHPAYILYTSGTTGQPKGVLRPTAGHLVALQWSMKNIYGVDPGEVFWTASDVGWVVGHSYICYAPLLAGNTSVMFEGKPVGTPDAAAYWRVISEHGVRALFTAPTAFRAIKKGRPARPVHQGLRSVLPEDLVPCRGARRPRHDKVGGEAFGRAGHRPLVANRNRMGPSRRTRSELKCSP